LLGNLRRYTAGTAMRFATRRGREGLRRSLRIARALPPYTSPAARHEAKPLSAPSLLWREGWGKGRALAKSLQQGSLKATSAATWPQARCRAAARASQFFKPLAPAVRGGREGPEGGMGRDAHSFSPGQGGPVEKPGRPSRTGWAQPNQRQAGVPFLLVTFLWASKEK